MSTDSPSRVERHLQWLESVRPGWAQEIRECMATGVEARVCADIAARQRLGIAKYGCTVEQSPDDMNRHAYEEALDLAVYLRADMEKRLDVARQRDAYAQTLRMLRVECHDFIDQRHPELAEEK